MIKLITLLKEIKVNNPNITANDIVSFIYGKMVDGGLYEHKELGEIIEKYNDSNDETEIDWDDFIRSLPKNKLISLHQDILNLYKNNE